MMFTAFPSKTGTNVSQSIPPAYELFGEHMEMWPVCRYSRSGFSRLYFSTEIIMERKM